jgi:potassium efflux system protein
MNTTAYFRKSARRLVAIAFLLGAHSGVSQEVGSPARLTPELLQSQILAAQDSGEFDEDTKIRLIALLRQSLANLQTARVNRQAAEEYREIRLRAPVEAESIRTAIEQRSATSPTADLENLDSTSNTALEDFLDEERANLTAVDATRSSLDARLEAESLRPAQVRDRITEATLLAEELATQSALEFGRQEDPAIATAADWATESRLASLQAEIGMLDQELLSHRQRIDLLRAQREEAALSITRISERVELLRSVSNIRRVLQAETAIEQATSVLASASAEQPIVRELAETNSSLVELLQRQVEELALLTEQESNARPLSVNLTETFRNTRLKLQLGGAGSPIGLAIQEQRRRLPDETDYERQRREVQSHLRTVGLRLLESEEGRSGLNNFGTYIDDRVAEDGEMDAAARADLSALAETRRELLDRAITNDIALQRRLYALDNTLQQLAERTTAFDEFLAERLLWVRSTPPVGISVLRQLSDEVPVIASPAAWVESARATTQQFRAAPAFLAPVFIALLLLWRRKSTSSRLVECGTTISRSGAENMKPTLQGLGLTLLLALPAPLILWASGRVLLTADETAFSNGVAAGLLTAASFLLLLSTFYHLYAPGGIAERHFGWHRVTVAGLRKYMARMIVVSVPLYFVAMSAFEISSESNGGTHGILAFALFFTTLAGFAVAISDPKKGVIGPALARNPSSFWMKWRYLWYPLTVVVPLLLAALGLMGFGHTVVELAERIFLSICWLTTLIIVAALARRWFVLTRRRLDYEAAQKIREAASLESATGGKEEREDGDDGIGEPEVDLAALDQDSRSLLNAALVLFAILGLTSIWGQMLPALGFLSNVALWNSTIVLNDVQTTVAITLADVLLAIVIGIGGYVVGKNLPSLLDIILLKYDRVSAGTRYAVSTLTRYAIVSVATLMVLGTLGASWSQMGWAAAALGVGIGFGLQEIVANFVSGLILLFEQPIRVGDAVTIGDASGIVTRIRMRATTIRDWDNKELIVPNKELVTGRLLNWSLSDAVIRVTLTVGVAYGSDVDKAMALLREAADENENVIDNPAPKVIFDAFDDSSLTLNLRAYIADFEQRLPTITALHSAVDKKFRAAGIVIAFPQRDVHHYSGNEGKAFEVSSTGETR